MAGLGILHLSREAALNMATSEDSMSHAVAAILGEAEFEPYNHNTEMTSGQKAGRVRKIATYEAIYAEVAAGFLVDWQRAMEWANQLGHCIDILPCTLNNTVLVGSSLEKVCSSVIRRSPKVYQKNVTGALTTYNLLYIMCCSAKLGDLWQVVTTKSMTP